MIVLTTSRLGVSSGVLDPLGKILVLSHSIAQSLRRELLIDEQNVMRHQQRRITLH